MEAWLRLFAVCRQYQHFVFIAPFFSAWFLQGKHVLVSYIMKPKAGSGYLATAAHFAANMCTTSDFTKSVDALVYHIDPDNEEMKIAYSNILFGRDLDGRGMMCSFLTQAIGNNHGRFVALRTKARVMLKTSVLSALRVLQGI